MIKNLYWPSRKVSKVTQNSNFMKSRLVGAEVFHKHYEGNGRFPQLRERVYHGQNA
jgi:hypothetical protein